MISIIIFQCFGDSDSMLVYTSHGHGCGFLSADFLLIAALLKQLRSQLWERPTRLQILKGESPFTVSCPITDG